MKYLIGKKLEMSQVWASDGTVVPVTLVFAPPSVVIDRKTVARDGYEAVILGSEKAKKVTKSRAGQLKDLEPKRIFREARNAPADWQRGNTLDVTQFKPGEKVQVSGVSKGKGFQGVVKRHGFAGGPASHGHKDNLRMPGAIGSGGIQRVFKGLKMGGRMGGENITVKNLEVMEVQTEKNILALKGAVPGARGSMVIIRAQ